MIIEILTLINLWCSPVEYEPEEFHHCRKTILSCVSPDIKANKTITQDSIKCFEKMERELKKNSQLTMMRYAKKKA